MSKNSFVSELQRHHRVLFEKTEGRGNSRIRIRKYVIRIHAKRPRIRAIGRASTSQTRTKTLRRG